MRSRLANRKLPTIRTASGMCQPASLGVLARLLEILDICRSACAAAHYYENMKPKSDLALDGKGLKRSDLPRAAFEKLSNNG